MPWIPRVMRGFTGRRCLGRSDLDNGPDSRSYGPVRIRDCPTRKPRRSGFSREDITGSAIYVSDLPPSRLKPVLRACRHIRD
jgi:hypothetical protein